MGFSSQSGHVAFMTQPVADTFPAGFAAGNIAMKLRTGSLTTNRDLLIPDPEIGGGRDVVDAYLGAVNWSGDYEFYARFNALLTLLYGGLGIKLVKNPGGTAEVQTLTGTGTISGGTFTITFSAQTTTAIAFDAGPGAVQAALEALSSIGAGNVAVTGTTIVGGGVFTLTFGGALLGDVAQVTVTTAGLTGTTPGITVATTTPGVNYVGAASHTFLPSDAAALPFLSIQERIGSGLEVFNYIDSVVNTLHFECDANGYLMGTAGMIARKQIAGSAAIDPTASFDNLPMVVGTNITVTYGGVTLPAKKFSFDLNNNFQADDFRIGSFYIGDLTPKRREVELGFTIREIDSALWRQASYGASAATTPGGITTKQALVITMSTYETIPGTTPLLPYKLELIFPQVAIVPYTLQAKGDDIIESDLTYRAVRPLNHQKLMSARVTTPKTTVN